MEDVIAYVWGHEIILNTTDKYLVSKIKIFKGHKTAFKFHKISTRTFTLIKGKAKVRFRDPGINWFDNISYEPIMGSNWYDLAQIDIFENNNYLVVGPGQIYQIEALEDCELYLTEDNVTEDDSYVLINGE